MKRDEAGPRRGSASFVRRAVMLQRMHISMGMPLHDIMHGIPIAIMPFIISQHAFIASICEASIGIMRQTMPSLVISQVIRHCIIGIIMPGIIGIMPFIIGIMPFIIGMPIIGIMPFIIGIMPFIIGMPDIGMGIEAGI
ncbi:hypothetical protein [Sandaracinus amylolyticus]|uniref:hypothetical protein n=1 Tax=Sandaracinus amylolyticus TaxID=927083 RepID=UPI001F2BEFFF|nr:hypothetical protein [Sandaracinus amylolyticus]